MPIMLPRRALAAVALSLVGAVPAGAACEMPPPMVLRTSAGDQPGALGSSCWGTCCIDANPGRPPGALLAEPGEALLLDTAPLGPLASLSLRMRPAAGGPRVRAVRLAFPAGPVRLPGDLPPGEYLVDVFAVAAHGGSSSQGFRVVVAPGVAPATQPGATPVSEPVGSEEERVAESPPACPGWPSRAAGPPRLVLRAASGRQVAGLGGYCWNDAGCVDPSGMNWPRQPLILAPGEAAEVLVERFAVPVRLRWSVVRDPGPDAAPSVVHGGIGEEVARGRAIHPEGPVGLPAGLPPGDYLVPVDVRARGRAGGDAHQGFRVRVLAPSPAPTTPAGG